MARSGDNLQNMLDDLNRQSKKAGKDINLSKTKMSSNIEKEVKIKSYSGKSKEGDDQVSKRPCGQIISPTFLKTNSFTEL